MTEEGLEIPAFDPAEDATVVSHDPPFVTVRYPDGRTATWHESMVQHHEEPHA